MLPFLGPAHRVAVAGSRGIVTTAHPLASLAGLNMLQEGGNAIDAAVAAAVALGVVEPSSSGIGGIGFMIIATPGRKTPVVLDFNGRAPNEATLDQFGEPGSMTDGIRSPLVPGAVAGWLAALERFGRMDRSTVFAPAIHHAEKGYPLTAYGHWSIAHLHDRLQRWPTTAAVYLPSGQAPNPGALLTQSDQARTLRLIVEGGAAAFYRGPIGEELVRFSRQHDGLLSIRDLQEYAPTWREPISTRYRDHAVFCPPPPCGGIQYLMALNIAEGFDLTAEGQNCGEAIHLLAESFKLAKADRRRYVADPTAPFAELLSTQHATRQRARIDPERAAVDGGERYVTDEDLEASFAGTSRGAMENTSHLVVADHEGFVVACTQTLGGAGGFGCGVVHGSTGVALNNAASMFDADPRSPNVIAPGKTPAIPLAPSQVWQDGKPFLVIGTPGSSGILQSTAQLLVNVLDHGFGIQPAIEAPRFRTTGGFELAIEDRLPASVVNDLRGRGHAVRLLDPWTKFVGGAQGILIDPANGAFSGGADPRRDGYALAF